MSWKQSSDGDATRWSTVLHDWKPPTMEWLDRCSCDDPSVSPWRQNTIGNHQADCKNNEEAQDADQKPLDPVARFWWNWIWTLLYDTQVALMVFWQFSRRFPGSPLPWTSYVHSFKWDFLSNLTDTPVPPRSYSMRIAKVNFPASLIVCVTFACSMNRALHNSKII